MKKYNKVLFLNSGWELSHADRLQVDNELFSSGRVSGITHFSGSLENFGETLRSEQHDLIIVNLGRQESRELGLLHHIANHPYLFSRPIVTVNGAGGAEEQSACQRLGIRCYIKNQLNSAVFSLMAKAIDVLQFSCIDGALVLQHQATGERKHA